VATETNETKNAVTQLLETTPTTMLGEKLRRLNAKCYEVLLPLLEPSSHAVDALKRAVREAERVRRLCQTQKDIMSSDHASNYYDLDDIVAAILERFDRSILPELTEEERQVEQFAEKLRTVDPMGDVYGYAETFYAAVKEKKLHWLLNILAQTGGANKTSKAEFTQLTGLELPHKDVDIAEVIYRWANKDEDSPKAMTAYLEGLGATKVKVVRTSSEYVVRYHNTNGTHNKFYVQDRATLERIIAERGLDEPASQPVTSLDKFLVTLRSLEAGKARAHLESLRHWVSKDVMPLHSMMEEAARDGWQVEDLETLQLGKGFVVFNESGFAYTISKTAARYFYFLREQPEASTTIDSLSKANLS
jgi:hypothetical protein